MPVAAHAVEADHRREHVQRAARMDEARKNTHATVAARNVSMRFSHTHPGVSPYLRATTCTDW